MPGSLFSPAHAKVMTLPTRDHLSPEVQIRAWTPGDREAVVGLIQTVLQEHGLRWDPRLADRDVVDVEGFYLQTGGEFWVIEAIAPQSESSPPTILGTGAYYPIDRGDRAVEIRKMYFHPSLRGRGMGRYLLGQLEQRIAARGFRTIWLETATELAAAVRLYESSGYQRTTGVETQRCDRVYVKHLPAQYRADSSC